MTITPDDYLQSCKRRFGSGNPKHMRVPAWEWMVRNRHSPYGARQELGIEPDYGVCGLPNNPDWCFQRMGMPSLELPDGRRLSIAGEHEDFYDPDFCIYNDLIVQHGEDIQIYGYPHDLFPPTDFHTATLVGDQVWLVGSIGYHGHRGTIAQVLLLDSNTYTIQQLAPTGTSPGWLSDHRAKLLNDGVTIEVSRGKLMRRDGDREVWRKNTDVFQLNTKTLAWQKLTDTSSWRQYTIEYEQDVHDMSSGRDLGWYTGEILTELGHKVDCARDPDHASLDDDDDNRRHTVWIRDIPVRIDDRYGRLGLVIEGNLPEPDRHQLIESLRSLLASTKRKVTAIVEC